MEAGPPDPMTPSVLWNGMIAPLRQMRMAGAVWYQAESNARNATNYACRFPAMIDDWRVQMDNDRLYFYFVLLAPLTQAGDTWPVTRDAQLAGLTLPRVGVASGQDLGDEAGSLGPVHPRNKTILGQRLALLALHDIYHQDVQFSGPALSDIVWPIDNTPTQTVILRYSSQLPSNQGLKLLDTSECSLCCRNGTAIIVTTSDGLRRATTVTVFPAHYVVLAAVDLSKGPQLRVMSLEYNYDPYSQCTLYNQYSLPQLPFNITRP